MRVVVLCECSGVVRESFRALGHDAWSCDIQPADDGSPYHFQADALEVAKGAWDLAICHPPCTDIAVSGASWFKEKIADGRQQRAIEFFMEFTRLDHIPQVAIENPVCIMSTVWRKPDQIIQPYEYGHPERKKTCLWLKGLPKLIPTENVYEKMLTLPKNQQERLHYLPPSPDRAKMRSRTFAGIAIATSAQWSATDLTGDCRQEELY